MNRKVHRVGVAAATALTLAVLAACGSDPGPQAAPRGLGDKVTVTYIGDITGAAGFAGQGLQQGMELALQQAEADRMLGDTKVVLNVENAASDAGTAASLMSRAVRSDAVAIVGPLLGGSAQAAAPMAQKAQIPYIAAGSDGPGIVEAGDYVFRTMASQPQYAEAGANYLIQQGIKSVSIVYATENPVSNLLAKQSYPGWLAKGGVQIKASEGVPASATEFGALTSRLLAAAPEAVVVLAVGAQNAALVSALRRAGFHGAIMGNVGMTAGALKAAGAEADGVVYAINYAADSPTQSSKTFSEAFTKANAVAPNAFNADGYDAMQFILLALRQAKSADRADVRDALRGVAAKGFPGAQGALTFPADDGRQVVVPGLVVEWRNGAEKTVFGGN